MVGRPSAGRENRTIKGNPVYPVVDNPLAIPYCCSGRAARPYSPEHHIVMPMSCDKKYFFLSSKDEWFHGRLSKSSIFRGAEKRVHK